jgi:hypothetical protein
MRSKPHSPEFERFTRTMDALLAVPHAELKAKLDEEKELKAAKKRAKTSPASRVSADKG